MQVSPWLENHVVTSLVVVLQDITERLQTRSRLDAQREPGSRSQSASSGSAAGSSRWPTTPSPSQPGSPGCSGSLPPKAVRSQECERRIHPDDRRMFADAIAECVRAGSASCECRVVRPDGGIGIIVVRGERCSATTAGPITCVARCWTSLNSGRRSVNGSRRHRCSSRGSMPRRLPWPSAIPRPDDIRASTTRCAACWGARTRSSCA